jgi:hypothetical protein
VSEVNPGEVLSVLPVPQRGSLEGEPILSEEGI